MRKSDLSGYTACQQAYLSTDGVPAEDDLRAELATIWKNWAELHAEICQIKLNHSPSAADAYAEQRSSERCDLDARRQEVEVSLQPYDEARRVGGVVRTYLPTGRPVVAVQVNGVWMAKLGQSLKK